jgi:hypothetical protein
MNCDRILLSILVCFVFFENAISAETEPCAEMHFGEDVTVRGKMAEKTYAGPPNYQSIRRGDTPERVRILKFDKPVCLHPSTIDLENETKLGVSEAQLVFLKSELFQKMPIRSSQSVFVTGQFFSAQSGHHHTPALLEVLKICTEKSIGPTQQCIGFSGAAGARAR